WVLAADGVLLTFAMLSLGYFYGVTAQARGGESWRRRLFLIPAIMIIGAGITFEQTAAVARGLAGRRTPFRRTPKYRIAHDTDRSWRTAAYRMPSVGPAILECAAGAALLTAGVMEAQRSNVLPSGLVLLFGVGFLWVGGVSLLQMIRR
ncbi:MAG: hypothetical protein ACE10G_05315, partial [Gemmatimonadales bacterium]